MKRTILTLTLAVILLIGVVPLTVFADGGWNNNLGTMTPVESQPAQLEEGDNGVTVSKTTGWDAIAISNTKTKGDFMLETDVTFVSGNVANLVFGAEQYTTAQESFVCKLDRNNRGETKIFCFSDSRGYPTIAHNNGNAYPMNEGSYRMKIVVLDGVVTVYVGDMVVCSAELPDYYKDGYLGIGAAEGSVVTFQNTVYTDLSAEKIARITDISVDGLTLFPEYSEGTVEYTVLDVPADRNSVNLTVALSEGRGELTINGKSAEGGKAVEIPLTNGFANAMIQLTDSESDTKTSYSVSFSQAAAGDTFKTNLTGWTNMGEGTWSTAAGGYQGVTGWDGFAVAEQVVEGDFKLEMDVTMLAGTAFGIIFNSTENPAEGSYMVNFDYKDAAHGQKFRWTEFPYRGDSSNNAETFFADSLTPELGKTYHVELTYQDGKLTYVFDGITIFDKVSDGNADVSFTGGRIGVMGFNSTFVVNNLYVESLAEDDKPIEDEKPVGTVPVTGDNGMVLSLLLTVVSVSTVLALTKRRRVN